MSELLGSMQAWWIGSAVGGGTVLFLAGLFARRGQSPDTVQRFGEWGMVAALLVAVLRFGPTWLDVPVPRPAAQQVRQFVTRRVPEQIVAPEPVDLAMMPWPGSADVVRDVPTIYQQLPEPTPAMCVTVPDNSSLTTSVPTTVPFVSLADSLLLGYLGVAGLLVVRWLAGQWALARLIHRGRHAPEPVQQVFDRVAMQTGQTEARLIVSDRVPVPMCCGIKTSTVVIPRSLVLRNDPTVWRWIFAHELTHLARRDTWSTWIMGLAQAVYFYIPWFYSLRRQIRLSQEYAADAFAAAQSPFVDDYAQFLVSFAHCSAAPQGATGVLGTTSDLYRRVTMVLQPKTGGSNSRRQLVSGIACLLTSAVVLAGLGVHAATPNCDCKSDGDGQAEAKRNVIIEVIADDDAKKDGDKKDGKKTDVKKRVMLGDGTGSMVGGIDKAEIEKKLRKALEKVKLADEDVEKIVKEVTKGLDGAKFAIAMAPLAGQQLHGKIVQHLDNLKDVELPAGVHIFGGDGAPQGLMHLDGVKWSGAPMQQGRLGISADKPGAALVEHLGLAKDSGLLITDVKKNSAAEKAGFKANDIILAFAGKDVPNDVVKFIELLNGVSSDKEVDATVLRKGKKETISGIKLAEKVDRVKMAADAEKHAAAGEHYKAVVEAHAAKEAKGEGNKSEKKANKTVSVSINNDEFKATEKDGESTLVVTGTMENKKVTVTNVSIDEPGFSAKYSSLDKVPSKYKARVEKLISNSGDSPVRFNIRKE